MTHRSPGRMVSAVLLTFAAVLVALAPSASAAAAPYVFAGPVFGLAAGPGSILFAADSGAGVVRLEDGAGQVAVALPGVTDVGPVRPGLMWAISGKKLYRITHQKPHFMVGLGKFERIVNPDENEINSNPFDVAALGSKRSWFPTPAPTRCSSRTGVAGSTGSRRCPINSSPPRTRRPSPDARTDPPTSANCRTRFRAAGDDECRDRPRRRLLRRELKGFPAPPGASRIWRIDRALRHVHCDVDTPRRRAPSSRTGSPRSSI